MEIIRQSREKRHTSLESEVLLWYRPVLKNQKTGMVYDLLHDVDLRAVWVESVPQMQAWS